MRWLPSLVVLVIVAGSAAGQPADYLDKVESMPDFLQTDKDGEFAKGGSRYCGPVSASNGLLWLSQHGYPKLAPAAESDKEIQIQLIRTLASPQFMDTQEEDRNGTNASSFLRGLDAFVRQKGYGFQALQIQGDSPLARNLEAARVGAVPDLKWIKKGISNSKGMVCLSFGYYDHDPATHRYVRKDGHWVTLAGYRGDTLIVSNPAASAGKSTSHDELHLEPLGRNDVLVRVIRSSGASRTPDRAVSTPSAGFFRLSKESAWKKNSTTVLDAAVVLIMR
jgi:hypothetical protein